MTGATPYSLRQFPSLYNFNVPHALLSDLPDDREDAERMLAMHVRLIAVARSISLLEADDLSLPGEDSDFVAFGRYLSTAAREFIFEDSAISRLLDATRSSRRSLDAKTVEAAAHLLLAYASAIPVRITDRQTAARYRIGIEGYLLPRLRWLVEHNSDTAANQILAIRAADVDRATARYVEQLRGIL